MVYYESGRVGPKNIEAARRDAHRRDRDAAEQMGLVTATYGAAFANLEAAREDGIEGLDLAMGALAALRAREYAIAKMADTDALVERRKLKVVAMVLDYLWERQEGASNRDRVVLVDLTGRRDTELLEAFEADPRKLDEIRNLVFSLVGADTRAVAIEHKEVHSGCAACLTYATGFEGVFIYETVDAEWPEGGEGPLLLSAKDYYGLAL